MFHLLRLPDILDAFYTPYVVLNPMREKYVNSVIHDMRTENVLKISKVQFLLMCKYSAQVLHLISKLSKSYCIRLEDLLLNVEHSISCHLSLTFSLCFVNVYNLDIYKST